MRHRGVDRDHRVEARDQRRGIGEVLEPRAGVDHVRMIAQDSGVAGAQIALQADEPHAGLAKQRREAGERQRAIEIVAMRGAARPGDADQRPRRRQPLRPALRPLRRHRNVRHGRRNGRGCRAERARQAHQRTVQVEARQLAAARDDGGNARDPGEQRHQVGLDLQDHVGAAPGDQRGIAHELDGVAETLLGVQQHGLAREVLRAGPQRRRERPPALRERGRGPAPFVRCPAGREIAEREPRHGELELRLGEIRPERDRPLQIGDRLLDAVEPAQRVRAVGQKLRVIPAMRSAAS